MGNSLILRSCTYITSFLSAVHAFSVTVRNNPTQCDSLTISWTGGQAPFEILVTPVYQPLFNISVPSSAFSNNQGSYSISPFPFKAGTQLLLTMSDAMGFGSGGTTNVLTVGASVSNNNCNTTLWQAFSFSTSSSIQQCSGYTFSDYGGAQLPVTITGLIPSGEPLVISPVTSSSYDWVANVQEGTRLLFFMTDSKGEQGGVNTLETVADSTDSSCLGVNSPSSTLAAPSQTSSQGTSSGTGSSKAPSVAVIAGASAGGGVLLAFLIALAVCCTRRASRSSHVKFPPESKSSRLQRKGDGREVIRPTGGISDPPPM